MPRTKEDHQVLRQQKMESFLNVVKVHRKDERVNLLMSENSDTGGNTTPLSFQSTLKVAE